MWWTIGISIYVLGFLGTFWVHITKLQMVTLGLATLRSFVWPIWWFTGWPSGAPLGID